MAQGFESSPQHQPPDDIQYAVLWRQAFGPEQPVGTGRNMGEWLAGLAPETRRALGAAAVGIGARHREDSTRAALEVLLRAHYFMEQVRAVDPTAEDPFVKIMEAELAGSSPDNVTELHPLQGPTGDDGGGEGQLPLTG